MHAQIVGSESAQSARLAAAKVGRREAGSRRIDQHANDRSDSLWADFLAVLSVAIAVVIVIQMILPLG
ncbi:MAG TPA: hypothetical protein VND64_13710 [Pirellulales bacterium]|nr:hypothetical protein [Pirellulales bacterium]